MQMYKVNALLVHIRSNIFTWKATCIYVLNIVIIKQNGASFMGFVVVAVE